MTRTVPGPSPLMSPAAGLRPSAPPLLRYEGPTTVLVQRQWWRAWPKTASGAGAGRQWALRSEVKEELAAARLPAGDMNGAEPAGGLLSPRAVAGNQQRERPQRADCRAVGGGIDVDRQRTASAEQQRVVYDTADQTLTQQRCRDLAKRESVEQWCALPNMPRCSGYRCCFGMDTTGSDVEHQAATAA